MTTTLAVIGLVASAAGWAWWAWLRRKLLRLEAELSDARAGAAGWHDQFVRVNEASVDMMAEVRRLRAKCGEHPGGRLP